MLKDPKINKFRKMLSEAPDYESWKWRGLLSAMRGEGLMYTIMAQRYSGDVTIAPTYRFRHYRRMLADPRPEFVREMILAGERATWPKISMIQSHARISKTLERCVRRLKQENYRK